MNINFSAAWATAQAMITAVGLQVLGAIVIYVVGRWLIGFVLRAFAEIARPREIRSDPFALLR